MKRFIWLAAFSAIILASCEQNEPETGNGGNQLTFDASIGDAKHVTRATTGAEGNTYSQFVETDKFGVYMKGGMVGDNINAAVTKTDGKWETETGKLTWDEKSSAQATLNAYFPYQADLTGGYNIFKKDATTQKDVLEDVLVANRTDITHGNPSIYLTFTHRFALLCITVGNGFDGFSGTVSANVGRGASGSGIAPTADISADGIISFKDGNINNFPSTKDKDKYYVIVPAETAKTAETAGQGDNVFKLNGITVEGVTIEISSLRELVSNTIYHLTVYKNNGTPVLRMGKIEQWADAEYLGGIKGRPGIYTEEDLVKFSIAYKKYSAAADAYPSYKEEAGIAVGLDEFGYWSATDEGTNNEGKWFIYLRNTLDMTLLDEEQMKDGAGKYVFSQSVAGDFDDVFKGEGRAIGGLNINKAKTAETNDVGFFSILRSGSRIENLVLADISVYGQESVGALAGTAFKATITNCHVSGTTTVTGLRVGGLIGYSEATVDRCSAYATVTGTKNEIGGLIGYSAKNATIQRSFAKGKVTSTGDYVGGLVGSSYSVITDSYASVRVSGNSNVGGLAGHVAGDIRNSYATGDVSGATNLGGLIGMIDSKDDGTASSIINTSASGSVNASGNIAGGLIGYSLNFNLSYSFSTGAVTGPSNIGGLIGAINTFNKLSSVSYCYTLSDQPLCSTATSDKFSIRYSYDRANKGTTTGSTYYSISLSSIPTDLLSKLNAEPAGKSPWIDSQLLINGKSYKLPTLTINKP